MAMITTVKAIITANAAQFQKTVAGAQAQLKGFGQKAAVVGSKLKSGMGLALIAVGTAAVKAATDFEASMTQIETLVGRSAQEVPGPLRGH